MQQQVQRQWIIQKAGFEHLVLKTDAPVLKPQGLDLLVKIITAGVNPLDWKRCLYDIPHFLFPGLVGVDCFGLVVAKGEKVGQEFQVNKTYIYYHGPLNRNDNGTFAEYSIQDSRHVSVIRQSLIKKSKDIRKLAADLTSLICTGWTAYQIVYLKLKFLVTEFIILFFQPNLVLHPFRRNVVVTAAAGGVGAVCVQLLNIYRQSLPKDLREQFRIIGTCSSQNFKYVNAFGATHTIDYNTQNVVEEVLKITDNKGPDVWIDNVGEQSANSGLNILAHFGELVIIVDNANYENQLYLKSRTVHNILINSVYMSKDQHMIQELKRAGDEIQRLYEAGQVKAIRYTEFPLEELKENLIKLSEGKVGGKLIMVNQK